MDYILSIKMIWEGKPEKIIAMEREGVEYAWLAFKVAACLMDAGAASDSYRHELQTCLLVFQYPQNESS